MKRVYLLLLFILGSLSADEITRIESIVDDITKLRVGYEKSQEELELCKFSLKDEKEKSSILLRELDNNPVLKKQNNDKKIIKDLKNKIKYLEKQLKSKEVVVKKENKICLINKIENENKFPKLQMKKEILDAETLRNVPARSFRVNKNAQIYDAINGKVITQWEENTSFTSNKRTENWVKVTGHFVDKIWQKSKDEMWMKSEDTKERDSQ